MTRKGAKSNLRVKRREVRKHLANDCLNLVIASPAKLLSPASRQKKKRGGGVRSKEQLLVTDGQHRSNLLSSVVLGIFFGRLSE